MAAGTIDEAIYNRLTAYAGLSALVSTRIYPRGAQKSISLPMVTWFRVDDVPEHCAGSDPGVATLAIQVDGWAATYLASRSLAAQIRAALSRWSATDGSVTVQDVFVTSDRGSVFHPEDTDAAAIWQAIVEFDVFYLS